MENFGVERLRFYQSCYLDRPGRVQVKGLKTQPSSTSLGELKKLESVRRKMLEESGIAKEEIQRESFGILM